MNKLLIILIAILVISGCSNLGDRYRYRHAVVGETSSEALIKEYGHATTLIDQENGKISYIYDKGEYMYAFTFVDNVLISKEKGEEVDGEYIFTELTDIEFGADGEFN
ncbi:hypothetical protein VINI7043_05776 [Vibrio nigripulchritudo ATCC 27043]|uniref:hypothetical protein n=1 Tax=Vibrio nigripulchritudo TaxID=28173 RepID=UPI00021C3E0A|nr:hypothetical protein [Vibrio nigripulchritudo]EGU61326.1 hypothetical protein VINI7043_05776 [Vibrio nigripulchritudo ATCC 27043]